MVRRLTALLLFLPAAALAAAPPPPPMTARAWLLVDFSNGQTIVGKNVDERIEPASLTKLMSAYLTFDALKKKTISLAQTVNVSRHAWKSGGSRMFIEPRKPVTVEELLYGMIVQSGNDATIALAEQVAGSEEVFTQMMNREAQELGLKDTNFVNSTGWPDPKHYSTARDLATLSRALIRDFPDYYPLYSTKEYRYNGINQPNRNRLLWLDPSVDGVKTGHTETAGYCLIASAHRGDRRLLSVVLGASTEAMRIEESSKLLNYGFQFYDSVRLYEKGQVVGTLRVWKGVANEVQAGADGDVRLVVPRDDAQKVKAEFEAKQPLIAPVGAGQKVGVIHVSLDGKPLGEYPAVALEEVAAAGFFGRTWDTVKLWWSK